MLILFLVVFKMAQTTDISTLIEKSSSIRNGRPCIAGTGVSVRRIVGWYKLGYSPEEITKEIPHLNFAQVYAALTYYHANQEEIEQDITEEEQYLQELEDHVEEEGVPS